MYHIYKITSNSTIDFAAEELKKYLRMMMPRCGEISIEYMPDAVSGLRIGLMSDFGLDTSDADDVQLDDIIYIDTDEKSGIIAGSNPCAVLIAVYRYLRFCGCRWLFPGVDGEWIPIINSLPAVSYRKLADHRYRGQCNEGAEFQQSMLETIDFTPKIGMNTYMLEFDNPYFYYNTYYNHNYSKHREPEPIARDTVLQWKRQCESEIEKRGLHFHDMGHGWTAEPFGIDSTRGWAAEDEDIVPPQSRQYLAMIGGERKLKNGVPLNTNICMSQPEARKIMIDYIADYAEKQNNVDFLHIWLADGSNGHCECEECQKKNTSDWYVILLNELDEELTRRNLDTHLVFLAYLDLFWPPIEEKIKNQKRFTMLFAPITRLYTETYLKDSDMSKIVPYCRNNIQRPRGMSECLGYLDKWKEMWKGDCYCYEYHFMDFNYMDISNMYISKLIYDDISGLKKHGINGIIEDGSQRSYFPTGFPFYVYGETLFDSSISYDELKEDYFSHAFGTNWKAVTEYLDKLRDTLDFSYFYGRMSVDESKGRYYCPDMESKVAQAREIVKDFKDVIKENRNQYYRASSVAWQLLKIHCDMVEIYCDMTAFKCVGNHEEAIKCIEKIVNMMSEREIYIERYYDHYMFSGILEGYCEGMRGKVFSNMNL